jgi:hypothetical protein
MILIDVLSTGIPELDRLVGYPQAPMGEPEVKQVRDGVEEHHYRQWTPKTPLGFPVGRISVVEGPEAPRASAWAKRVGAELDDLSGGPLVFVQGVPEIVEGAWTVPKLALLAKQRKKAVVFVTASQPLPKALRYYAHLRLRFEAGRVKVVKSAISGRQGHSMTWPPVAGELDQLEQEWAKEERAMNFFEGAMFDDLPVR